MSVALRLSGRASPRRAVPCRVCFDIPGRAGPCRDVPCVLCVPTFRRAVPSRAVHALTCRAEPSRAVPRVIAPFSKKNRGASVAHSSANVPRDKNKIWQEWSATTTATTPAASYKWPRSQRTPPAMQQPSRWARLRALPILCHLRETAELSRHSLSPPQAAPTNMGSLTQAIQPSAQAQRPAARVRPA
jgi:hypothetical protein